MTTSRRCWLPRTHSFSVFPKLQKKRRKKNKVGLVQSSALLNYLDLMPPHSSWSQTALTDALKPSALTRNLICFYNFDFSEFFNYHVVGHSHATLQIHWCLLQLLSKQPHYGVTVRLWLGKKMSVLNGIACRCFSTVSDHALIEIHSRPVWRKLKFYKPRLQLQSRLRAACASTAAVASCLKPVMADVGGCDSTLCWNLPARLLLTFKDWIRITNLRV